jgi:hypothetical protein
VGSRNRQDVEDESLEHFVGGEILWHFFNWSNLAVVDVDTSTGGGLLGDVHRNELLAIKGYFSIDDDAFLLHDISVAVLKR